MKFYEVQSSYVSVGESDLCTCTTVAESIEQVLGQLGRDSILSYNLMAQHHAWDGFYS